MYAKLRAMRTDDRPLVLAYGSWGLVAGRTGACNKGNPPCIGVGLMRKIARRFLVVPTPEQYTSKTCHRCRQVYIFTHTNTQGRKDTRDQVGGRFLTRPQNLKSLKDRITECLNSSM